jgi:hypothetical protein
METIENGHTMYEMKCPVRLGNLPESKPAGGAHASKQASKAGHKEGETRYGAEKPLSRTPVATRRSCAWYPPPSAKGLTSHGSCGSTVAVRISPGPGTEKGGPSRPAFQPDQGVVGGRSRIDIKSD